MKEKPMSVRFEQGEEREAILKAAKLEGLDPAVYVRSAAVRFTREKHPEAFPKPEATA